MSSNKSGQIGWQGGKAGGYARLAGRQSWHVGKDGKTEGGQVGRSAGLARLHLGESFSVWCASLSSVVSTGLARFPPPRF